MVKSESTAKNARAKANTKYGRNEYHVEQVQDELSSGIEGDPGAAGTDGGGWWNRIYQGTLSRVGMEQSVETGGG